MNREIKFRGKRIDTGEWIYGDLLHNISLVQESICKNAIKDGVIIKAVHPKTVGQNTGLKDKNDKEIYEGDIVSYGRRYMQVIQLNTGEWALKQKGFYSNISLYMSLKFCEVVGNIHENPELLEKKRSPIVHRDTSDFETLHQWEEERSKDNENT